MRKNLEVHFTVIKSIRQLVMINTVGFNLSVDLFTRESSNIFGQSAVISSKAKFLGVSSRLLLLLTIGPGTFFEEYIGFTSRLLLLLTFAPGAFFE